MTTPLSTAQFINLCRRFPIIDARTPAEFARGHLPEATNLPLFSDAERAEIGAIYKHQSREEAILRGLDFVGPKLRSFVEKAQRLSQQQTLGLYCWRGGMRSQSLAWLFDLYGYQTYILTGGYKAFRRYILESFELPAKIIILGGKTGSGKTDILKALQDKGQQVVDLEGLARHKGSAFGGLGQPVQPTQQQFENELGLRWRALRFEQPIWIEDESHYIGNRVIPHPLWFKMKSAPAIFIETPFELRVERLVKEYGRQDAASLTEAILKIKKRLGGLHSQQALAALRRGDLATCCAILLEHYYDKAYLHGLDNRCVDDIRHVELSTTDPVENAMRVLRAV